MLNEYRELITSESLLEHKFVQQTKNPICVGGVGGSGTRLLSTIFRGAGYSLGDFLMNKSLDNLFWPPMQRLLLSRTMRKNTRDVVLSNAFSIFESHMNNSKDYDLTGTTPWVSKVPGSYLFLEEMASYFPNMKYIHLIRHGADMAFAQNLMQFRDWSFYFGIYGQKSLKPGGVPLRREDVLEYWIRANRYAIESAKAALGDRFLIMSFDDLCLDPEPNLKKLFDFVGDDGQGFDMNSLKGLIRAPSSIGRYKEYDYRSKFSGEQLQAVESLGFSLD